jgi:hypothetical protein
MQTHHRNRNEIITITIIQVCDAISGLDQAQDRSIRFLHSTFKDLEGVAYGYIGVKMHTLFKQVKLRVIEVKSI